METKSKKIADSLELWGLIFLVLSIIGSAIVGGNLFSALSWGDFILGFIIGGVCGFLGGSLIKNLFNALADIILNIERTAIATEAILAKETVKPVTDLKKSDTPDKSQKEKLEEHKGELNYLKKLYEDGEMSKEDYERRKNIILGK